MVISNGGLFFWLVSDAKAKHVAFCVPVIAWEKNEPKS